MSGRLVLVVAVITVVLGGCVTGPPPEAPVRPDPGAGSPADRGVGEPVEIEGQPIWATKSEFPGGIEFDGVDDMVGTGFSPRMDGDSAFTITAWIKTKKAPGTIFAKTTINQPAWPRHTKLLQIWNGGLLTYYVSKTVGLRGRTNVADGQWHHVAVTKEGNMHTLYVDGEKDAGREMDMSGEGTKDGPDHVVVIGLVKMEAARDYPGAFSGKIDDVRFYDRALSQLEIQAISLYSM